MDTIIKRSNRRSVAIKINEKGQVFVCCPKKFSLKNIDMILKKKEDWINKTLVKINEKQQRFELFYDYKKIMFLGLEYNVEHIDNLIKIGDNTFKYKGKDIKKGLKTWLIKQANKVLLERLLIISQKIGINYHDSSVISARKKWGSCDNLKDIKLNYRLVMLPLNCIDYVIVHELCHTKQMNHSKRFWNLVESYLPNYREIQNAMKEYSFVLELF